MSAGQSPRTPGTVHVQQTIGAWTIEMRWPDGAVQGGPRELVIRPAKGADPEDVGYGLSQTVLRQIDFAEAAQAYRNARSDTAHMSAADMDQSMNRLRHWVADGVTDTYLAALAMTYVRLVQSGDRSVTARLAELTGKQPETIRAHLKRARQAGMLTSVKHRAGGVVTDKAADILRAYRPPGKLNDQTQP